jgi:hypothetical protein
MWDLGTIGGLISAAAIYCLIWWTLMKRLRFIPQLSAEAGRLFRMEYGFLRRVVAGYLLTGIIHLSMVFGSQINDFQLCFQGWLPTVRV